MKKIIEVHVCYLRFTFDDIDEAVKFAETALEKINKEDADISIDIEWEDEDEV